MFVLTMKRMLFVAALALLALFAFQQATGLQMAVIGEEIASRWGIIGGQAVPDAPNGDEIASRWSIGAGQAVPDGATIDSRWGIGTSNAEIASRWAIGAGQAPDAPNGGGDNTIDSRWGISAG